MLKVLLLSISIPEFIGRFHPLLVHLPIGILLLALLLQFLSRKEKFALSHGAMKVMWLLGMFSAVLSCLTGYLLSLGGEYEGNTVNLHMWMGIGVALVSMLVCAKVFAGKFDIVYKSGAIALLLLITITGHLGGSLTHGDDFLTAGLQGDSDTAEVQKVIPDIQAAAVYTDVVAPVLQQRCYSCHGPQKQKGGLRMDSPEWLLKGGKEAKAIIPGQPDASELLKRLLLPREHEDHMPPKQKTQLKEAQITLIQWWIQQGAPFDKKVHDLQQPEKIKPLLLALQGAQTQQPQAPPRVPEASVEKAAGKDVQALQGKGALVMPVARDAHYLSASFINAPAFTDQDAALLLPLKKQLVWLKLGDTKIGDPALKTIGQCRSLTVLHLNGTGVTDQGLASLQQLSSLQSLNLVGTQVSARGLEQLRNMKGLQSLYLYKTRVTAKDWPQLQKVFPKTMLDSGGYKVPVLPTDTTVLKPAVK